MATKKKKKIGVVGLTGRKRGGPLCQSHFFHRTESRRGGGGLPLFGLSFKSHRQLGGSTKALEWHHTPSPPSFLPSSPFTPPHLSSEPGTVHFLPGPMPTSPPGNVFPALVVVGHIITLIAVWRWRVSTKQGKTSWRTCRHQGHFRTDRPRKPTWKLLVVFYQPTLRVESALLSRMFLREHTSLLRSPLFFSPPHSFLYSCLTL